MAPTLKWRMLFPVRNFTIECRRVLWSVFISNVKFSRKHPPLQLTKATLLFNLNRLSERRDFITLRGISLLTRTPFVWAIFYSFQRFHTGVRAPQPASLFDVVCFDSRFLNLEKSIRCFFFLTRIFWYGNIEVGYLSAVFRTQF